MLRYYNKSVLLFWFVAGKDHATTVHVYKRIFCCLHNLVLCLASRTLRGREIPFTWFVVLDGFTWTLQQKLKFSFFFLKKKKVAVEHPFPFLPPLASVPLPWEKNMPVAEESQQEIICHGSLKNRELSHKKRRSCWSNTNVCLQPLIFVLIFVFPHALPALFLPKFILINSILY